MIRPFAFALAALTITALPARGQTHSHPPIPTHHAQGHTHSGTAHDSVMVHIRQMVHHSATMGGHGSAAHDSMMAAHHGISTDSARALHENMSALAGKELPGTWTGIYETPHASAQDFRIVISRNDAWSASITLGGSQALQLGRARNVQVKGHRITWTQEAGGSQCQGVAVFLPANEHHPEGTLGGTLTCEQGTLTFVSHREPGGR